MILKRRLILVLRLSVCLLILKVTISVVSGYIDYFPPDFSADFLVDRESYFFGSYQWAFYSHIASGPFSLIAGLILLSDRFRQRFPRWHARLGRCQVACILLLIFPSGLWMAFYARSGWSTKLAFVLLAVSTAMCAGIGWRFAAQRRFGSHQTWMQRCYLLLCSAVVIRLIGGAFLIAEVQEEWTYGFAAWVCWLVPLFALECFRRQPS